MYVFKKILLPVFFPKKRKQAIPKFFFLDLKIYEFLIFFLTPALYCLLLHCPRVNIASTVMLLRRLCCRLRRCLAVLMNCCLSYRVVLLLLRYSYRVAPTAPSRRPTVALSFRHLVVLPSSRRLNSGHFQRS